jgi:hypothetical protein
LSISILVWRLIIGGVASTMLYGSINVQALGPTQPAEAAAPAIARRPQIKILNLAAIA